MKIDEDLYVFFYELYKLYITKVEKIYDADIFFPSW